MTPADVVSSLTTFLGDKLQETIEFRGETTLVILPSDLREVAKVCRDDLSFDYLLDVSSVDNFGEEPRFEMVYELYSMKLATHLRLKFRISEDGGDMPTVSDIWPTANWHEREVYDMMGLRFADHPDLRRILMWDEYPYFPLRKDFPLAGLPTELSDPEITEEIKTGVISAPMAGGPFVATPGEPMSEAEPRAKDEAWNEQNEKPE